MERRARKKRDERTRDRARGVKEERKVEKKRAKSDTLAGSRARNTRVAYRATPATFLHVLAL